MTDANLVFRHPGIAADAASQRSSARGPTRAALQADGLRILVTSRLADLDPYWPRIAAPGPALCHVFQCAELLAVWLDTLGRARGTRPCFVAVLDARDRPVMLLPFGIERRHGAAVLGFLDGEVSDYNTPVLFTDTPEWTAETFLPLWQRILAALPAFDVALFEKMPAEVGGRRNPLMLLDPARDDVSGHLRSAIATPEPRRPPHHTTSRRKMKKLAEIGPVAWVRASTAEEYRIFLDAMLAQKQRRFVETRVPGFELPGKRAYYEEATRRLADTDKIHLSALKVGETIVASHWGLLFGDRLYELMPGHAGEEWSRFSPGRLLNDQLAQWCDARRLILDFGVGDEAYKAEYCDVTLPLYRLARAMTAAGRRSLRLAALLAWLRATRVWQAVRPWKWIVRRALP